MEKIIEELTKIFREKMQEPPNCTDCPFIQRASDELARTAVVWMNNRGLFHWPPNYFPGGGE